MGQLDNTIVAFTTDNGAEAITYPDGGVTPFKGGKLTTWEGGMRAPLLVRRPGHIKPGTIKNGIFSALDWVPTLVNIAGSPYGYGLKKEIKAGKYPCIIKTTLDGFDQRDYLEGKSDSARDTFFYYSGHHPSAVRYKNWKFYCAMVPPTPTGTFSGILTYHWTMVDNIKRDPFEQNVDQFVKSLMSAGGALAAPSTGYLCDWNLLPIGQALWMKELETYKKFPSLQPPVSYNLDQVIAAMKDARHISHTGDQPCERRVMQ
jgi:arylsulfatase A-like enzyme